MATSAASYRLGTHQSVAFTGTAGTIANAFAAGTTAVRVIATSACYLLIDNSPTATTASVYLAADVPEVFLVTPGQKASAVQVSAGGTLHVTELS
jgi:hypothetical protein